MTWSSFGLSLTSIVRVLPFGPFSVTVPASLSMAETVPRTFVTDVVSSRPASRPAPAPSRPGRLVVVDWAKAGDWVSSIELAIRTAVIVVLM